MGKALQILSKRKKKKIYFHNIWEEMHLNGK